MVNVVIPSEAPRRPKAALGRKERNLAPVVGE